MASEFGIVGKGGVRREALGIDHFGMDGVRMLPHGRAELDKFDTEVFRTLMVDEREDVLFCSYAELYIEHSEVPGVRARVMMWLGTHGRHSALADYGGAVIRGPGRHWSLMGGL